MKKLLITLSALAASAAASQAVMIYDSTDPDNPSLMSEWGVWNTETWTLNVSHSNFIWKGSGSTSDNIMKNCYVLVDKDFTYTTSITVSGSGGNHNNMNHIMDGTSITYDTSDPLPFNNTTYSEYTTNYSMGFYFTAAPESTGTLNFLRNTTFDLYSQDIKYGGTKLGKFGRVISFGEGITANFAGALTVGGRNSELTVSDSLFNVAGTMNVARKLLLSETIANFSGNVSAGNMTISGTTLGTNLTLTGSLVVSGMTSVATNSSIAVTGSGHFEFNGGLASTWTTQTNNPILVANTAGNVVKEFIYMQEGVGVTVTADNDWNTARLLFRGGQGTFSVSDGATLEVASLLSISTVSGKISKISVEDGSLLIVGSTLGSYDFSETDSFVSFGELDGKLNYLNILGFSEGSIAFREIGTADQQSAFLSHVKLDGAISEDLRFSDFDSTVGGYWLTTAPIPEPATWAAIFGAVGLGFAAYRRRK